MLHTSCAFICFPIDSASEPVDSVSEPVGWNGIHGNFFCFQHDTMSGSEFQVLTVVFWKKILYTKDGSPEDGAALPETAVRIAVAQTAAGMCNDWRQMERPRIAAVLFWALSAGEAGLSG